jgi:putative thioredoxin
MSTHNEPTPYIVDATPESFEREAIERSRQVPVVVDFWAPWCQPCRLLGPLLEKLAREYDGRFVLVKANTEELPQQAARFGVQSIPTVFGLRDGALADSFTGLLPEEHLRVWLDRLLPTAAELLTAEAAGLESSDPQSSEAKYREALVVDAQHAPAKTGLARLLLAGGRIDESRALLAELEERGFLETEAQQVKAALDLQLQGQKSGGVEECRAAVAHNPDDLPAQFRLAEALAASEQYREALEICLELVRRDRHGLGEEARRVMVDVFRLLEDRQPELVSEFRRQLSAALY